MGAVQIFKIIFLIVAVILAIVIFTCGIMLKRFNTLDFRNKDVRVLLRVRTWCFVAMLVALLLIVVIT